MHITLSLLIYIVNVNCKFKRDITDVQLHVICKNMSNKIICIDRQRLNYMSMLINLENPYDINLMKVI